MTDPFEPLVTLHDLAKQLGKRRGETLIIRYTQGRLEAQPYPAGWKVRIFFGDAEQHAKTLIVSDEEFDDWLDQYSKKFSEKLLGEVYE